MLPSLSKFQELWIKTKYVWEIYFWSSEWPNMYVSYKPQYWQVSLPSSPAPPSEATVYSYIKFSKIPWTCLSLTFVSIFMLLLSSFWNTLIIFCALGVLTHPLRPVSNLIHTVRNVSQAELAHLPFLSALILL